MKIAYHTLTWANYYKEFDLDRELREIHDAGFSGIEFVESLSKLGSSDNLKSKLKNYNLTLASLSCGLNMSKFDKSDIEETKARIEYANEFDVKPIMICGGWLLEKRPKCEDDFKLLAEKLEIVSEYANEFAMSVAFHPHKDTIVETEQDIERLSQYLSFTKFCIDIAHLAWCGSDPLTVIEKNIDNTVYVHLKDWSKRLNNFVELGMGEVKIIESIELLNKLRYNGWMTVELDHTASDPYKSAQISSGFLKGKNLL